MDGGLLVWILGWRSSARLPTAGRIVIKLETSSKNKKKLNRPHLDHEDLSYSNPSTSSYPPSKKKKEEEEEDILKGLDTFFFFSNIRHPHLPSHNQNLPPKRLPPFLFFFFFWSSFLILVDQESNL